MLQIALAFLDLKKKKEKRKKEKRSTVGACRYWFVSSFYDSSASLSVSPCWGQLSASPTFYVTRFGCSHADYSACTATSGWNNLQREGDRKRKREKVKWSSRMSRNEKQAKREEGEVDESSEGRVPTHCQPRK